MKYSLLALLFSLYSINSVAQNVGVGNANPAEKLDVTGNMRISGEIKPGGNSGTNGQVLRSNGAGGMSWAYTDQFKNQVSFTDTTIQNISWVVPAEVSRVWVEAWGGGGAGLDAGGGGGAYISVVVNVTPGQQFAFTVGKGAKDDPATNGQYYTNGYGTDTKVQTPLGEVYYAAGGGGAWRTTITFPVYKPGEGGGLAGGNTNPGQPRGNVFAIAGQPGGTFRKEYQSIGSNQYFLFHHYGNGGVAGNAATYNSPGQVLQYSVIITPPSTTVSHHSSARGGIFPGGGGGGGTDVVAETLFNVRSGANGMVLVHY